MGGGGERKGGREGRVEWGKGVRERARRKDREKGKRVQRRKTIQTETDKTTKTTRRTALGSGR